MFTLAIEDGDLTLVAGSYATRDGVPKAQQDITLALGEPLGNDRFHPGYGSILHTFVGSVLDQVALFSVQQEVNRVIGNYSAVQYDLMAADALRQSPTRFSTSEIVGQVSKIEVSGLRDTVSVRVSLRTADETDLTLSATVGAPGA